MKLSVIIPVYNVACYLERCMDSLLAQTYRNREIILVDDGSTDGSGPLCDRFAMRDSRTRVVHQENSGLGMARNCGLDRAAGEYVLFLDPDDYYGPDLLKNLVETAQRTAADLIIGGHTLVGPDGRKKSCAAACERVFRGPEELRELLLHTVGAPPRERLDSLYGVSACGRLYRREVIQRSGLRFVSERVLISEDLIFNLEFLRQADSAAVTTDASYFYCTNNGSLSKRHRDDRFEQDCALYLAVGERLARWYPEDQYWMSLARLLISRARYDMIQEVDYYDQVDRSGPLREKIRNMLCRQELCLVLKRYPWWKLPWMQRAFTWSMKYRQIGLLLALVRLKRHVWKQI